MNKQDLLLEIGLEEMPARFVSSSISQLATKVTAWLEEKKIAYDHIQHFSTPRRLAVLVHGVAVTGADTEEEAKGPAKKIALTEGEWSKAAIGFTRGQGMSVDDIYFKEVNGTEYAHVRKFIKGSSTIDVLPELQKIVTELSFPKNMRWANETLRYIRPIKWIVALFGSEVVPFGITDVTTSNVTLGHRFLGSQVTLSDPSSYQQTLLGQFVIADATERKNAIRSQLAVLEQEQGWVIPVDEDLLEEVTNLVEYPTVLFGKFDANFLELPGEVLITSMKEHQRYFPVKQQDGTLLPFFVTVRNGDHQHLETVAKGNEKVLKARLSDANFFYREDQKLSIESCLAKLSSIVYHEEIGTLADKVGRVRKLTNRLSDLLGMDETNRKAADRAAEIAKFDLVTHMVYEFPELQGFMGEKYAVQKGESELVAEAINEHYMPRNAEDGVPSTEVGAVLAVAEKLDTIVSFFAIGNIPSGSQDPYALRRQASGIVQILIQKQWPIDLTSLLAMAVEEVISSGIGAKGAETLLHDLVSFFKLRVKHYLSEAEIRYDIIESLLALELGDLSWLVQKSSVLQAVKDEATFKETIEALSRVITIASKATSLTGVKESLFENDAETLLYAKYQQVYKATRNREAQSFYVQLASLKDSINQFFDVTMVMADDEQIRTNRLNLMYQLSELIKEYAAMNEILTK